MSAVPDHHHAMLLEAAEALHRALARVPWLQVTLRVRALESGLAPAGLSVRAEPHYDPRRLGADTDPSALREVLLALARLRSECGPQPWAAGTLKMHRPDAATAAEVEASFSDGVATPTATRQLA